MSLLLDDEKIAAVAQLLELAGRIGTDVYQTVSDALKNAHPELLPADLPGLEAASRNDPDELTRRLTPSRFDQAAAAAKRVPSGTMAAVRDTDPAPPPTRPSER
jgi:hypothetical protein